MSARRKKDQPPMKYRGFYCDDTLYSEMQNMAEKLDESDSEYIRKAVEMRNKGYDSAAYIRNHNAAKHAIESTLGIEPVDSTHKNR